EPVASTIVDGGPPGVLPPSSKQSMRSPIVRSTSSGLSGAGPPLTLALVAVSTRPHARHSARATSCAGTLTPTRPAPPITSAASVAGAASSSVSGPGQKLEASARAIGDGDAGCG